MAGFVLTTVRGTIRRTAALSIQVTSLFDREKYVLPEREHTPTITRIKVLPDVGYHHFFGQLVWICIKPQVKYGEIAGRITECGYRQICVDYRFYYAHRVIWEQFNGPIPDGMEIDHIDTNKDCNYLWNLRLATRNQNMHNRGIQQNNTSGIKGVCWEKSRNCWQANIQVKGARKVKRFKDKTLAEMWVMQQRVILHNTFSRHG